MKVKVWMIDQAQPITRFGVTNTYTKGGMFALMQEDGTVEKYPLCRIFRVKEES